MNIKFGTFDYKQIGNLFRVGIVESGILHISSYYDETTNIETTVWSLCGKSVAFEKIEGKCKSTISRFNQNKFELFYIDIDSYKALNTYLYSK